MPKALLHVGTMKTGTTSIQTMLTENAGYLAAQNTTYLGPPMRHSDALKPALDRLEGTGQNLIISDEGLWHFANTKRSDTDQLAKLLAGYDVTVLIYLRRPDSFLTSWFQQGVKTGSGARSFSQFMDSSYVQSGLQFLNKINRFSALFGAENLILRAYEKDQLIGGDAVLDFAHVAGLDVAALDIPARTNTTPSTDNTLLRALFRGPIPRSAKQRTQLDTLDSHLADRGFQGQRYSLLNKAEMRQLVKRFYPMFETLHQTYGVGVAPAVFTSWPDPDDIDDTALRLRWIQEAFLAAEGDEQS